MLNLQAIGQELRILEKAEFARSCANTVQILEKLEGNGRTERYTIDVRTTANFGANSKSGIPVWFKLSSC